MTQLTGSLPVAHAQNILPYRFTSGYVTSCHAQWYDPPHDPPQMLTELCPYTINMCLLTKALVGTCKMGESGFCLKQFTLQRNASNHYKQYVVRPRYEPCYMCFYS